MKKVCIVGASGQLGQYDGAARALYRRADETVHEHDLVGLDAAAGHNLRRHCPSCIMHGLVHQ